MDDDATIRDAVVNEIRHCGDTGVKFNAHKLQKLLLQQGITVSVSDIRKLRTQALGREAAERASAKAAARRQENRRLQLSKAISEIPDPNDRDTLFDTVSLRLELLGFADLAEEMNYIATYGQARTDVAALDRIRYVAELIGWTVEEVVHEDNWGLKHTSLTLRYNKNTIDVIIYNATGYVGDATWRIADTDYAILAPQRKYGRVDVVLGWMREVIAEPSEGDSD